MPCSQNSGSRQERALTTEPSLRVHVIFVLRALSFTLAVVYGDSWNTTVGECGNTHSWCMWTGDRVDDSLGRWVSLSFPFLHASLAGL